MDVSLEPGTYVVAVSGGVDSMVLLDVLRRKPHLKLIVAHFDHGIRDDSAEDRKLVQRIARSHGLPFVYGHGSLGAGASEDAARQARYAFLRKVRDASGARAIVTAHHEDDLLETAVLNLLRGTGRRGLTSIQTSPHLHRPLLVMTKPQLIDYARQHNLMWREDSTNQDLQYRRNVVRHELLTKLEPARRKVFLTHIRRLHEINRELDDHLVNYLHMQSEKKSFGPQGFHPIATCRSTRSHGELVTKQRHHKL